jgi:hypothetical protein
MYIHDQDDPSSNNKKNLALKANQEKKSKARVKVEKESSSDDDINDAKLALVVKKTTKCSSSTMKASNLIQEKRSSL